MKKKQVRTPLKTAKTAAAGSRTRVVKISRKVLPKVRRVGKKEEPEQPLASESLPASESPRKRKRQAIIRSTQTVSDKVVAPAKPAKRSAKAKTPEAPAPAPPPPVPASAELTPAKKKNAGQKVKAVKKLVAPSTSAAKKVVRRKSSLPAVRRTTPSKKPVSRSSKPAIQSISAAISKPALKPGLQELAVPNTTTTPARPAVTAPPAPPAKSNVEAERVSARAAASPRAVSPALAARKAPFYIPPILLEGDEPVPPPVPLRTKAPQPVPEPAAVPCVPVFASARDPYCLFVSWDISPSEQCAQNLLARGGHCLLRASWGDPKQKVETQLHPESTTWFLHVPAPNQAYEVELGYYLANARWVALGKAPPVRTPRDSAAEERIVQFATAATVQPIPAREEIAAAAQPKADAPHPARSFAPAPEPVAQAPQPRSAQPPTLRSLIGDQVSLPPQSKSPEPTSVAPSILTSEQEQQLEYLIFQAITEPPQMGSAEIQELLQKGVRRPGVAPTPLPLGVSSAELPLAVTPPIPSAAAVPGSQPAPLPRPAGPGFWFNVNAELVVYGATEPTADVIIGGRPIRLRPDGTFSCRFALPDGQYQLPIRAVAAHGDWRQADLRFSRNTVLQGEVGTHPQDPRLRPPSPENL